MTIWKKNNYTFGITFILIVFFIFVIQEKFDSSRYNTVVFWKNTCTYHIHCFWITPTKQQRSECQSQGISSHCSFSVFHFCHCLIPNSSSVKFNNDFQWFPSCCTIGILNHFVHIILKCFVCFLVLFLQIQSFDVIDNVPMKKRTEFFVWYSE